jgi:RimJ/RimL family protein N-acetyltransferase
MIFDRFKSRRLSVEPIDATHSRLLFEGLRDDRIYQWISAAPPRSVEQLADAWRLNPGKDVDADVINYNWAVKRREDGAWIGKMDAEIKSAKIALNVGYIVFPPYWRSGYASEAIMALAKHLELHGVVEQYAFVTAGNIASMKALERAGFVCGRILKGNDTIRGVAVDDIEYVRSGAD